MRARIASVARSVFWVTAAAATAGAVLGAAHSAWLVVQNEYWSEALHHLAARTVSDAIVDRTVIAVLGAWLLLASVATLWPLGRVLRGSWERGLISALVATPLLAAYLAVGLHANRRYLPGFFEPESIAANLGLAALALGIFLLTVRALERRRLAAPSWRRTRLRWLLVGVPVGLIGAGQSLRVVTAPRLDAQAPGVLLILVDALRPDRLGPYGYQRATTPKLDRFAQEAWVWDDAVAPSSWTKPSVASLFTSLYPREHGVATQLSAPGDTTEILPPRLVTLAERLADAGYRTAAFGENHHLLKEFGFGQGFGSFELHLAGPNYLSAYEIIPRFLRWLDADSGPFFGYLHFIDVHFPYLPPSPFAGSFSGPAPALDYNTVEFMRRAQDPNRSGPLEVEEDVVQHMSDSYDEEIRFVDSQLGRLFDELRERDLYDPTMIVVTSDHGEEFMEHGELAHGTSLYDVLLRVPLLIKFPCPGPLCGDRRVSGQVELIDVAATVLGVAGIPLPPELEGRDLVAEDRGSSATAFGEFRGMTSVRTGRFKYLVGEDGRPAALYDLETDPGEQRNVLRERPQVARELHETFERWDARTQRVSPADREVVEVDAETRRALEALGYVQPESPSH